MEIPEKRLGSTYSVDTYVVSYVVQKPLLGKIFWAAVPTTPSFFDIEQVAFFDA